MMNDGVNDTAGCIHSVDTTSARISDVDIILLFSLPTAIRVRPEATLFSAPHYLHTWRQRDRAITAKLFKSFLRSPAYLEYQISNTPPIKRFNCDRTDDSKEWRSHKTILHTQRFWL